VTCREPKYSHGENFTEDFIENFNANFVKFTCSVDLDTEQ